VRSAIGERQVLDIRAEDVLRHLYLALGTLPTAEAVMLKIL
jgi:hypothetical protein